MGDANDPLPYGTVVRRNRRRVVLAWIVAGVIVACFVAFILKLPAIERRFNEEVGKAKRDAIKRANEFDHIPSTNP